MGQKDHQVRGEGHRDEDQNINKDVDMDASGNLRQRVREFGQAGRERLQDEVRQIKQGRVQNAPIISGTTMILATCLLLMIPLGLYLRHRHQEEELGLLMKLYEHRYDELWEDTKDSGRTVRDKAKDLLDYLNSIDTDHYRKMAKGKAHEAQKKVNFWKKDIQDFYDHLPSASSVAHDMGDTMTQWKDRLVRMKNDGFEHLYDQYRHLTGRRRPINTSGLWFYIDQLKHFGGIMLAVAGFGLALLMLSHLATNYYFVKNPPARQREVHVARG